MASVVPFTDDRRAIGNGKANGRHHAAAPVEPELPNDPCAEEMIVGEFLKYADSRAEMVELVRADRFYHHRNAVLMEIMLELHQAGAPVEMATIIPRLGQRGERDDSLLICLDNIDQGTVSPCNWRYYWGELEARAKSRDIIFAGRQMLVDSERGRPADLILADVQHLLTPAAPAEPKPLPELATIDHATFLTADLRQNYLVDGMLVQGQNCIFGGRQKTLKTTAILEMAVSLATATPVFDTFAVPSQTPVLILSGESGQLTLRETVTRVYTRKGLTPSSNDPLFWGFSLPKLHRQPDCEALERAIEKLGAAVVVIDPAYLCLLDASQSNQASNLFAMGGNLGQLTDIGSRTGATMVLVHHLKKGMGADGERFGPPNLEDLSMSGFAEWARCWVLLSRREQYVDGSGEHALWMRCGGSAGHSSLHALTVNEGYGDSIRGGRRLDFSIEGAAEARERAKENGISARESAADNKVLQALESHPDGATRSILREQTGFSGGRINPIINRLISSGQIEETEIINSRGRFPGVKKTQPWTTLDNPGQTLDSPGRPTTLDRTDYVGVRPTSVCPGSNDQPESCPGSTDDQPTPCSECSADSLGGICFHCKTPVCFACKSNNHRCGGSF